MTALVELFAGNVIGNVPAGDVVLIPPKLNTHIDAPVPALYISAPEAVKLEVVHDTS
jgi:hypothetical protein